MRRQRRTKIVATLGPASGSAEMVDALFRAGADVFRLNFSHGTHKDHIGACSWCAMHSVDVCLMHPQHVRKDMNPKPPVRA